MTGAARSEDAAELAVRQVPTTIACALLEQANRDPASRRVTLVGAAAVGSPACVPLMLDALDEPDLAPLARFGLRVVLGLGVDHTDLPAELGLEHPTSDSVRQWWHEHRTRFDPRARYLLGHPMGLGALRTALRLGPQAVRSWVAHDLSRLHGAPHVPFEVDAPAWRQQRLLETTAEVSGR